MALTGSLEVSYEVLATGTSGETEIQYEVSPTSTVGETEVAYEVLPAGFSNLFSTGAVQNSKDLPSQGAIPANGEATISYEVRERPRVTAVFNPVADAYVWDAEPTINYGDLVDLVVGRSGSFVARSLLRFDVSSLRTDLEIISAALRLHARITPTGTLEVRNLLGSWEELGVTWANQPARAGIPEDETSMEAVVDLDVTPLFMGWYRKARANNGISVLLVDEGTEGQAVYSSREWPGALMRPELRVTYYEPDALPAVHDLYSAGFVRGSGGSDLPSSGAILGFPDQEDLLSTGDVSRQDLPSRGTARQKNDLPSTGTVRGTRLADDFPSLGAVSRPDLPSRGSPRVPGSDDLASHGYVLEHDDLPSTGSPRVPGGADLFSYGSATEPAALLPSVGEVRSSLAAADLPSTGAVGGASDDLPSTGMARATETGDLPSAGRVSGAPNELPSQGAVASPWLRSQGMVRQHDNLWSQGRVRVHEDLTSTGFVIFEAADDLPATGLPRIRGVGEIPSTGYVGGGQSDLPSRGHVNPWIFRFTIQAKTRPPHGRAVKPPGEE